MNMTTLFIWAGCLALPLILLFLFWLIGRKPRADIEPPKDWNYRVQQANIRDTTRAENKSRRAEAANKRGDEYPTYRTGQR